MIYLNNKIVHENKALISVYDHGFLYGDGVYETLRVYRGVVFRIEEHIERLFRSASMIGLNMPIKAEAVEQAVYSTLRANKQKEAVIRITVSRGAGPLGLDPALCSKPTFVIMSHQFKHYPETCYTKGIKIALVNTRRNLRNAVNPQIKSINFLNNILAKREAIERNSFEAIMLNYRGYIAEGTVSNVFFVHDNVLCTPGNAVGILDGITRKIIIDTARRLKIKTREGNFKKETIYTSQEVFISNTTMEVMPVSEVDDITISKRMGKITKLLHSAYMKNVSEYIDQYLQEKIR